jgi:hypothetical protein
MDISKNVKTHLLTIGVIIALVLFDWVCTTFDLWCYVGFAILGCVMYCLIYELVGSIDIKWKGE